MSCLNSKKRFKSILNAENTVSMKHTVSSINKMKSRYSKEIFSISSKDIYF